MTNRKSFGGKLFERPLGFSKRKLCTKCEVSSSNSFEEILDRLLENLWVMGTIICCPARLSQDEAMYQI